MDLNTVKHVYFINGDNEINPNEVEMHEYSIDELKRKVEPTAENIEIFYQPFRKTGTYYRTKVEKLVCMTKCNLDNEKWRKHPEYNIGVSNYGRVRSNNKILEQFEQEPESGNNPHDGYLEVIVNKDKNTRKLVYQLVAETWLINDNKKCVLNVHHINNNGYENTPENLVQIPFC